MGDFLPFRVSSGPSVGRTIVIAHNATEALRIYRMLKDQNALNLEISHLERGELSFFEVEAIAEAEPRQQSNANPS